MHWTRISKLGAHAGTQVEIRGWVRGKRSSGKLVFLQVRDGSGTLQCTVFRPDVSEELFAIARGLTQESSLVVTGEVRPDERAAGGFELAVTSLEVVAAAADFLQLMGRELGERSRPNGRHARYHQTRQ